MIEGVALATFVTDCYDSLLITTRQLISNNLGDAPGVQKAAQSYHVETTLCHDIATYDIAAVLVGMPLKSEYNECACVRVFDLKFISTCDEAY